MFYNENNIKSRIKFLSNLPLRQGGKKDVVNQQLKELKMKKIRVLKQNLATDTLLQWY